MANPNFPTKHLAKDTRLFLAVAESLGLDTSALEGIEKLLDKTLAMGLDNTDYSAIMAAVSPKKSDHRANKKALFRGPFFLYLETGRV